VDPRLRFLAGEAGGNGLAEAQGHHAGALDEASPRPDFTAVERDRDDRQVERPVEAGEAGLERRPLAGGDPGALGEDDDRSAFGDRLGGGIAVTGDAVESNPSFGQLFTEYNKYLLRRSAVLVGI